MTKRKAQELQEISVEKNGEDVKVSGLPGHILRGIREMLCVLCLGFRRGVWEVLVYCGIGRVDLVGGLRNGVKA